MANTSMEEIPAEGIDISGNLTVFESITQLPSTLWQQRDLLMLQGQIVFAALACIYLGSVASLRRPPSASPPPRKKNKSGGYDKDEVNDDQFVQGLVASDAIMFPILAGTVLVGLYYLIKWLEDPDILNKIMGVYFSVMSLASMGKFLADSMHFLSGLVFPGVCKTRDGTVWHFDTIKKCQYRVGDAGERVHDEKRTSPIPGLAFASEKTNHLLWIVRHLLHEEWTVRFTMHGVAHEKFKVRLNDVLGVVLAVFTSFFYHTTKANLLSNVMGYAFSYVGIITLSPTTFPIGTAVLFGLFFYDIYMVFYTPYMVTVATKLDVPIKLVFENKKRSSMLGLGDIVVPGIFVGLCLRFDHFMHYYRQRKLVPVELKTEHESADGVVAKQETHKMVVKPKYVNPQGQWGNWLWTRSRNATPAVKASSFPKTYFKAAMFGYFIAMLTTLAMLLVFQHAQPALLYLVPGVVSAVWITGAVRGELKEMWIYTEDGSLDNEDVIVEVDENGNVMKELEGPAEKEKSEKEAEEKKKSEGASLEPNVANGDDKQKDGKKKKSSRPVFAFIIDAPPLPTEDGQEE